jgi:hypothetical protein
VSSPAGPPWVGRSPAGTTVTVSSLPQPLHPGLTRFEISTDRALAATTPVTVDLASPTMPMLDALARELDTARVAVIGLNEDVDASAARWFVSELGIRYPSARGGGRLQSRYAYRGLPYTVILDREHRVAKAIYGFGASVDPILTAVQAELAR